MINFDKDMIEKFSNINKDCLKNTEQIQTIFFINRIKENVRHNMGINNK